MSGQIYLATAYLGMISALAIWTWTVLTRSHSLESRIEALEKALGNGEE